MFSHPLTVDAVLAAIQDMDVRLNDLDTAIHSFSGTITDNAEIVLMVAGHMLGNGISTLVAAITLANHVKKDGATLARCRLALVATAIEQVESAMKEDLTVEMRIDNNRLAHALLITIRHHFGNIVDCGDMPVKDLSLRNDEYIMMMLKGLPLAEFERGWCLGQMPLGVNTAEAYIELLRRCSANYGMAGMHSVLARDVGCLPMALTTQIELTIALANALEGVGPYADAARRIKSWLNGHDSSPQCSLRRYEGLWSIMVVLGNHFTDAAAREGLMEVFTDHVLKLYPENGLVIDFLADYDHRSPRFPMSGHTNLEDWAAFVAR